MHRLYKNVQLSLNDDLLAEGAFLGGDDEEIDAVGIGLDVVRVGEATATVVGLEPVDEYAPHVVHLHLGFAFEMLEIELHLSVVGVGDDGEIGGRSVVVVNAIE